MEDTFSAKDIIIPPGIKETASEDGAVLLDIKQGICFSLNPVGLKIWEMLKQHHSIEQIADSLEREFHNPRAELVADVRDFVAQLEARNLIRHEAAAPTDQGWLTKLLARRTSKPKS